MDKTFILGLCILPFGGFWLIYQPTSKPVSGCTDAHKIIQWLLGYHRSISVTVTLLISISFFILSILVFFMFDFFSTNDLLDLYYLYFFGSVALEGIMIFLTKSFENSGKLLSLLD